MCLCTSSPKMSQAFNRRVTKKKTPHTTQAYEKGRTIFVHPPQSRLFLGPCASPRRLYLRSPKDSLSRPRHSPGRVEFAGFAGYCRMFLTIRGWFRRFRWLSLCLFDDSTPLYQKDTRKTNETGETSLELFKTFGNNQRNQRIRPS